MSILKPPDFVQEQVQLFLKDRNLSNAKLQFSNASKEGDNFLGSLYRLKIEEEKNGKTEELNVVIKCFPMDEKMRVFSRADEMFLNEIAFYEERFPLFTNLLNEFGLQFQDIPQYYGGSKVPKNETLILEDLMCKGFVLKESKLLDYPHAVLVARHLGRFHAYSFALRDKNPTKLEALRKIKEAFFFEPGCYAQQRDIIMQVAMKAVENEDKHYIEKVANLGKNAEKLIEYACDSRNSEPYATLNHGDLWTLNMLFKYNKNSEPSDIRFLDFQLHRYASPAMDILYTFFTCLTHETRAKHYDELLHHYHDSLSQLLRKMDSDVDKLFPFHVLLEHLERFGGFGACMSLIDLHLITAQEEDDLQPLYNLDSLKKLPTLLETNQFYNTMVRDMLKDMVDKNYL